MQEAGPGFSRFRSRGRAAIGQVVNGFQRSCSVGTDAEQSAVRCRHSLAQNLKSRGKIAAMGAPSLEGFLPVGSRHDARARGGTGRRNGLKIRFPEGSAGSTPAERTCLRSLRELLRGKHGGVVERSA